LLESFIQIQKSSIPHFNLLGRLLEFLDFFVRPFAGVLLERMYLRASAPGSLPAGEPATPGL